MNQTFVVSKVFCRTWYTASQEVQKQFPDHDVKRYDYASGYDENGTLLNHDEYWYFRIRKK